MTTEHEALEIADAITCFEGCNCDKNQAAAMLRKLVAEREAEAKLLETLSVQKTLMDHQASPLLLINTAPMHGGLYPPGGQDVAQRAVAHYNAVARVHGFELQEVASHEEAVHVLMDLN